MSTQPFAHLHLHTEFSILDGACNIDELMERTTALGMEHVGMTDHGTMAGAVQFYKAARANNIKPVIGMEAYLTEDRHIKQAVNGVRPKTYHLTMLAETTEGYHNLARLSSLGYLEGKYGGRPRIDHELLEQYSEGIIAFSGCLASRTNQFLLADNYDAAREEVDTMVQIFGADNFYLEYQVGNFDDQKKANAGMDRIIADSGLPVVATGDVHYLHKQDARPHDAMLCVNTGARISDAKRLKFPSDEFYYKSPAEMYSDFAGRSDEWLARSVEIAERCDVEIALGQTLLPAFDTPDGLDADTYLQQLCADGLAERYGEVTPELQDRLKFELETISSMGYSEYFLITWDWIAWAKEQGIAVGPGRGSAAGSLVSYTLGITEIDPIEYDLLFERFLNPDRVSMPDIDTDVSQAGRGACIAYLTEKYGRDRVAQLATFGRMAPKNAIRDAARVMDHPVAVGDKISKLIPEGPGASFKQYMKDGQDLKEAYDNDPLTREVVDLAQWFEGKIRNGSIHAAAAVIGDRPLADLIPLRTGDRDEVVTQMEQDDVEEIGLLKMDVLGLRNLDVLEAAPRIIKESTGEDFDLDAIPFDDPATYQMIARGETVGVFQLEGEGMQGAARQVGPTTFEDIVALISLYRPGPMADIPKFAKNKKNPSEITYADERLRPILETTYGITVYQEQYMLIARELANFTPGESDDLRKGIAKKKRDILDRLKPKFLEGCAGNGVDLSVAETLWEQAERAGDYSFNKSHAVCYAWIAYQTAYLKCHYPAEYMAALLGTVMNTKDKVPFYVAACERMGLEITPPNVLKSKSDFTVVDGRIVFGMTAIKGVGLEASNAIIEAREEDEIDSIWDLAKAVPKQYLNKRVMECLIKAGALDSFAGSRKGHLEMMEQALGFGSKQQADADSGQFDLFGELENGDGDEDAVQVHPPVPTEEYESADMLELEKSVLGFYISGHPLQDVKEALSDCISCELLYVDQQPHESNVVIGGMLTDVRKLTTKKGDPMAILQMEDLAGTARVVVFPRTYANYSHLLANDNVVIIKAKVEQKEGETSLFADEMWLLPDAPRINAVQLKTSEKVLNRDTVAKLQGLIRQHHGDTPVELIVEGPGRERRLRFGMDYGVNTDNDFFAELRVSFPEDVLSVCK